MQYLHSEDATKETTYADMFLVPQYSDVRSRMDVNVMPDDGLGMTIPIVVANMNAVSGKRMAETVARRGGLTIFSQDSDLDTIDQQVSYVKNAHTLFETPITLGENDTVQSALNLIYKRAHKMVVIIDKHNRPVGIFTRSQSKGNDLFAPLKHVMNTDLVVLNDTVTPQEAFDTLAKNHIQAAPVVHNDQTLAGLFTKKGALRSTLYTPALGKDGKMLTSVAMGINTDVKTHVGHLRDIGVDLIFFDIAHGYQKRMIEAIKTARSVLGPGVPLAAGTVVTKEATEALIDAGATIIKVGIGGGAMCSTRMMTGVGRPLFSTFHECAKAARAKGAHVWADGGVRHPRDVALALAAGASCSLFGSWFAGTYESSGDIHQDGQGNLYTENFGMASTRAVKERNQRNDLFTQAERMFFSEGISSYKMYLKEGEEGVEDIIDKIIAGVRSACAYSGARTLQEFYDKAVVGVQTSAGFNESRPEFLR